MGKYATLTQDLPEEYRKAHPICVASKVAKMGYEPARAPRDVRQRAAEECIREGKLHGIVKLLSPSV
ncbi:hypothetical protein [Alphaspiravirus yamagawaense]|uniref:Uncharacterized protein n=1 Tax=Alphaspiravirus yamagawaense TaxID=1157339 RepID=J7QC84_9VIRU|nr:hypothetical protein [Aeropyrum coil-shaped virus]CCG27869.1 hypothetical protein [Aeropyrum coil-shaped virus]